MILFNLENKMSNHVFVVSEWLAKVGHDEELYKLLKALLETTKKSEKYCLRANATRQINHPGSPGKSKYNIILLQEYENIAAFDIHCSAEYVKDFFKTYIDNQQTGIVEDWTCRLFTEENNDG